MKAAVIMGSASDADKVEGCIGILKDFGVNVKVRALSAHRAHGVLLLPEWLLLFPEL